MTTLQTELAKFSKEEIEAQTNTLIKEISAIEVKDEESTKGAKELEKKATALEKLVEARRVEIVKPLNDFVSGINQLAKTLTYPISESKQQVRQKQVDYAQKSEKERLAKENEVLQIIAKVQAMPDEVELELYADTVTNPDLRIKASIEAKRGYFEEQVRQQAQKKALEAEQARLAQIAREQGEEALKIAQAQADERMKLQKAKDELARQEEDAKQKDAEALAEMQREQAEKLQEATKVKGLRKVLKFEITDEAKVPRELCSPDESKIRASLKEQGIREIPGVRIWAEDKIQ